MTIYEAISAKLQPYVLPDDTLSLLALEQGIEDVTEDYDPTTMRAQLRRMEIAALWQLITLEKEEDNGSTQEYDPDMLLKRLNMLQDEEDNTGHPQNEDITDYI